MAGMNESAVNTENGVSKVVKEANNSIGKSKTGLEFVTDSPNVMAATRKYVLGERVG